MNITVSGGVGTGPTELSAFDQALVESGVANFNLLCLSSVLPPNSNVEIVDRHSNINGNWGDRLYVVMAEMRTLQPNQEVWAGIGWIQDTDGKGLLVEHEGYSEDEVRNDIRSSLAALADNRGVSFSEPQMHVVGLTCVDRPVCALVTAVFESEPWRAAVE